MYLVLLGLVLLLFKALEVGPVGDWSWWIVLAPFLGAALWWAWADASGYNKRRAMEGMEAKKAARRQRNMDAIGTGQRRK